eukprot:6443218-Amphidinium_carterae.1
MYKQLGSSYWKSSLSYVLSCSMCNPGAQGAPPHGQESTTRKGQCTAGFHAVTCVSIQQIAITKQYRYLCLHSTSCNNETISQSTGPVPVSNRMGCPAPSKRAISFTRECVAKAGGTTSFAPM